MGRALSRCGLRALALLLFMARPAQAHGGLPEAVELSWQAPDGCAPEPEVRAQLAQLLSQTPRESWPSLRVHGLISERPGSGYRLVLSFGGDHEGQRVLEVATCEGLARTAAVLITLVIEPSEAPATLPEREPEAEPDAEARALADEAEAGAGGAPLVLAIGPRVEVDVGTMPAPTLGVGAGAHLMAGPLELGITFALFPGTTQRLAVGEGGVVGVVGEPASAASVELSLWEVGVVGCLALSEGAVRVGPCGGLALATLSGRSLGVLDEASERALLVVAKLGFALGFRINDWLGLRLELQATAAAPRPTFRVRDFDYRFRPSALGLRSALALQVVL